MKCSYQLSVIYKNILDKDVWGYNFKCDILEEANLVFLRPRILRKIVNIIL